MARHALHDACAHLVTESWAWRAKQRKRERERGRGGWVGKRFGNDSSKDNLKGGGVVLRLSPLLISRSHCVCTHCVLAFCSISFRDVARGRSVTASGRKSGAGPGRRETEGVCGGVRAETRDCDGARGSASRDTDGEQRLRRRPAPFAVPAGQVVWRKARRRRSSRMRIGSVLSLSERDGALERGWR